MGALGPFGDAISSFWKGASGQANPASARTQPTAIHPDNTIYDPATGTLYDQATGIQYQLAPGYTYDPATGMIRNPSGTLETPGQVAQEYVATKDHGSNFQVHSPMAADQILQAKQREAQFLNALNTYSGQQAQGFAGEQGLANSLEATIHNPNAPSVARTQLTEALNASQAQQMAAASGVAGDNAALARQNAMRNMGGLATAESNEMTRLRAEETAKAQAGLSTVLNNMANQGQAGYNATGKLGEDYGLGGLKEQTDIETNAADTREKNAANEQKGIGGLVSGLGSALHLW